MSDIVYPDVVPTITATQSYSLIIRDVFFDVLANREPFFDSYTKRKTRMLPAQANLIPYLGVYLMDETMTPDGDANAGPVRFSHSLRIGFSVIIANNDQDMAERTIDAAYWRIMNRLWKDHYVMNLVGTQNPWTGVSNPDNVRIESITRGVRKHNFGFAGTNSETPIAELQYDVTCFYRTIWDPEF
jgi:hypothetical protein